MWGGGLEAPGSVLEVSLLFVARVSVSYTHLTLPTKA